MDRSRKNFLCPPERTQSEAALKRELSPYHPGYRSNLPNQIGYRSQSPHQTGYRSQSPHQTGYRSQSPHQTGYRSQSPHQTGYRSQSPHQTGYRSQSPHQTGYRSQSPHQTGYRSQSPHQTGYRSQSPHQTGYRSQSPHQTSYRSLSPHRTGSLYSCEGGEKRILSSAMSLVHTLEDYSDNSPMYSPDLSSFRKSQHVMRRMSRSLETLTALKAAYSVLGHHISIAENPDVVAEPWENKSLEICERELGQPKFLKRLSKHDKVPSAGFGSKTRLKTIESSKVKKAVTGDNEFIRHYNAVGAVGYAKVLQDDRIPTNDFFVPGKRFRVRLRHSNLRSDDDASSCQREVAIKFADQNEDGPLDLILFTGRVALARNCKTFLEIIKLKKQQDIMYYCYKNPSFFFALVDCLRRAPDSFADLQYYCQVPYKLIPKSEKPRLVRFRLVPEGECEESGLLGYSEQHRPWESSRHSSDDRGKVYLRSEFFKRLESGPVEYKLQIQMKGVVDEEDDSSWNPQIVWDEVHYPWIDLAEIKLTTPLTCSALKKTYYNITDKPPCLKFPSPISMHDYRSYHYVCCTMYTTMEIKRCGDPKYTSQLDDNLQSSCPNERVTHVIGVCTGNKKELRSRVDIYIALTGTHGRATPKRLDDKTNEKQVSKDEFVEYFEIVTEPIGDILALTLGVRHRHLTDDWYLRFITVSDKQRQQERQFPCHSVILSKATLRPGEVTLPQLDCHEVLRQERLLELREKQHEYLWQKLGGLPSRLKAPTIKDLPANEQLHAEKYSLLLWDVDTTLAEVVRPMITSAKTQLNHSAFGRMSSLEEPHRRSTATAIRRQTSVPVSSSGKNAMSAARAKWMKIKHAIHFIAKVKLPDGPQGEMCRLCQDDKDFARLFLIGSNPGIIKRCTQIPENFAVTQNDVEPFLDRGLSLNQEMQEGHVYIADYEILSGVPCFHQDGDHRYLCAPLCLLYVNRKREFVPLAIQLEQEAGPTNPLWTPRSHGEEWLLAKLWVRCADFHHQLMISHLLKCHFLIEPFCVSMLRNLSSSHPIYKLLKPHFRYFLPTNTLLRKHICDKGGAIDKWTSLGSEGFKILIKKYFKKLSFEELDFPRDLMSRGVEDSEKLPYYLYRDDGVKMWDALGKYCFSVITHFYTTNDDVEEDTELRGWLGDVWRNGFAQAEGVAASLPTSLTSICELADLVTKLLFTVTCQHSATTAEAMDLYGFLPLVPAMMRQPPPTRRGTVGRDMIVRTLPEQSPEAYYGSLAYALAMCKAENSSLGTNLETYFVEPEIQAIKNDLKIELQRISAGILARNMAVGLYASYDSLNPERIPNSVEPVPFCPLPDTEVLEDTSTHFGSRGISALGAGMSPAVPLMTLPICMQFARNLGGRSFIGRRLTVNMFSRAMSNVNVDQVSVPMQAIDRRRYNLRYNMYGNSAVPGMMMMM